MARRPTMPSWRYVLLAVVLIALAVAPLGAAIGDTPRARRRAASEPPPPATPPPGVTLPGPHEPEVRQDGYGTASVVINVMSGNLVSFRKGEVKKYGKTAARIIRALKPDIAGLQWFNSYHGRSDRALRRYIGEAFGPGFDYVRDNNPEHLRPPAIIFREHFRAVKNGTWDDPVVDDRCMTWVKLQVHQPLPGVGDSVSKCEAMRGLPCDGHYDIDRQYLPTVAPRVMVVSALFSGNAEKREMQARFIMRKLLWHYELDDPQDLAHSDECILLLAEFDTYTSRSSQLRVLREAGIMVESMAPTDQLGNPYTDVDRQRRRTYIVSNKAMLVREVPYTIGHNLYKYGTVFDSRVHDPPVEGVAATDSVDDDIRRLPVMRRFEFRVNHREREHIREERRRLAVQRQRMTGSEEIDWT